MEQHAVRALPVCAHGEGCSCPCTLCSWEHQALRVRLCAQAAQESPRARAAWSIGAVGRCLSRNLAENQPLGPECRALVIAAAPKACPLPHPPFSFALYFCKYCAQDAA